MAAYRFVFVHALNDLIQPVLETCATAKEITFQVREYELLNTQAMKSWVIAHLHPTSMVLGKSISDVVVVVAAVVVVVVNVLVGK